MQNSAKQFTILGSTGFVGTHLKKMLMVQGHYCFTPTRQEMFSRTGSLGHVIYAIGMTADFRTRPFDTVDAHVCNLKNFLAAVEFDSLTYLSSTRFYQYASATDEASSVEMNPMRPDSIYDLSKLMGESLCEHSGRANIKIARLSNVVGIRKDSDIFVDQILSDIISHGKVKLHSSLDSAKDYIFIDDAAALLCKIATSSETGCFNIASGVNVSNRRLFEHLKKYFAFDLEVDSTQPVISNKTINVSRIKNVFDFKPRDFDDFFPEYLEEYKKSRGIQ